MELNPNPSSADATTRLALRDFSEKSDYLNWIRSEVFQGRIKMGELLNQEMSRIDAQGSPDPFFKDSDQQFIAIMETASKASRDRTELLCKAIHETKLHLIDTIGNKAA
jgi:hypothetical protein